MIAGYAVGLQYAVKKYWKGKCRPIVCHTNPTVGSATVHPAHYVPASLSGAAGIND